MPIITTFEHAYLTQNDFTNPSDFDWLLEQNFDGLSIERKNKQWRIRTRHYIGVIGLPSGTQLEILPKISQHQDIAQTRQWLQQMLTDIWQALTPKNLPNLSHQTPINNQLSLNEWLTQIVRQRFQHYQPNQRYQHLEQNQTYLQGKLLVKQQLQHNHHQPHKFFHQSDEFTNDTACNRLVKTTLQQVTGRFSPMLASQWQCVSLIIPSQYQTTFIQAVQELHALPTIIATQNHVMIDFCYTLLTLQQATTQGQTLSQSLLINMQFAFEKWVTVKIQQFFSTRYAPVEIVSQKSQALTADNVLTIKPDIWLNDNNAIQVCDIKWKNITSIKDISLADMYQLMTYASEFDAKEAWLIIPTLDEMMTSQEIVLTKSNPCQFWLVPFFVVGGRLQVDKN